MKYLITPATEQTATHTGPQGLVRVVVLKDNAVVYGPRKPVVSLTGYTPYVKPVVPSPDQTVMPVTPAVIECERKSALARGCTVDGVTYAINESAQLAWTTGVAAVQNMLSLGALTQASPLPFPITDARGVTITGLTVLQFQQLMAQLTAAIAEINATAMAKLAALG